MNFSLRHWIPPILWMGLIFFFSSRPDLSLMSLVPALSTGDPAQDLHLADLILRKAAHITEYFILTRLYLGAINRGGPAALANRPLFWAAVLAVAFAATDEFHQTFVPSRTGTPIDVGIDAIGVTLSTLTSRKGYRAPAKNL